MELKPGYKQTEVGVIPDDWNVRRLGDIAEANWGNTSLTKAYYRDAGYQAFSAAGPDGYLDFYEHEEPAVLLSAIGALCGKTWLTGRQWTAIKNTIWIRGDNAASKTAFVFWITGKMEFWPRRGQAQPFISLGDARDVKVLLPPTTTEQSAIAAALSDVDTLLAAQDALIEKKRAIKQGAMQELLTGKRRLPGFCEEWQARKLGEISRIKTGSRNNEDKVEDGDYPFFVRSEFVERIDGYSYDCEAILVPGEGKIGEIFHYINGRFDVHQRVYAITRFASEVSAPFVHLYLKMHFGPWAMQNTVKATVDSLRLPTFQNFEMRMPHTKEEQIAIADALSDMDMEIVALEAKREKTAQLKQGMMQELLTGRIRLV